MSPLLRDRLIIGILIFVALFSPYFGLLQCLHGVFAPIHHRSVHSVSNVLSFRFSWIETRLRHVSRPKVLAHHNYLSKLRQECDMHCLIKSRYRKYRCIWNNLLVKLIHILQMFWTAQILQATLVKMTVRSAKSLFGETQPNLSQDVCSLHVSSSNNERNTK